MNDNIICVLLSKNNTFVATETYNRFLDLPDEIYGEFRLLETRGNVEVYKNMKRNSTYLKRILREVK